jgi:hypothetical protein
MHFAGRSLRLTASLLALLWILCASACGGARTAAPPSAGISAAQPPRVASPQATNPALQVGLSRPPTASEQRLIAELLAETEQIRKLRFKRPVEVRIQDRTAMRGYVSRAIEQEDLVRGRRRYVALGLLDPALDVRDLLESLMEEELVGYYDPKERLLAVRDDVARSLDKHRSGSDIEWRATVVHELVHALQDQHLGLGAAMDVQRTTDGDNAFGALVEGDATLAMLGYVAAKAGVPLSLLVRDRTQLEATLGASPDRITGALRAAPAIVREPLLFRYRAGALFAASLFERGDWAAVDLAHAHVPVDTLSVMDPRLYPLAKAPGPSPHVELPELTWLEPHGFRLVDEDVLGSLEFGVALGLHEPGVAALMRSWRGDRYGVLEPTVSASPGDTPLPDFARPPEGAPRPAPTDASIWLLRFATVADARQAETRLIRMPELATQELAVRLAPQAARKP